MYLGSAGQGSNYYHDWKKLKSRIGNCLTKRSLSSVSQTHTVYHLTLTFSSMYFHFTYVCFFFQCFVMFVKENHKTSCYETEVTVTSSCWSVGYHDNCEKCSPHCIFHHSITFLVKSCPPYNLPLPFSFKKSMISTLATSGISRF